MPAAATRRRSARTADPVMPSRDRGRSRPGAGRASQQATGRQRRGAARDAYAPPTARGSRYRSRGRENGRNVPGMLSLILGLGVLVLIIIAMAVLFASASSGNVTAAVGGVLVIGLLIWACMLTGLVCGIIGCTRHPKGMAIAGLVINSCWLLLTLANTLARHS